MKSKIKLIERECICGYKWYPRVEESKKCPSCGRRLINQVNLIQNGRA